MKNIIKRMILIILAASMLLISSITCFALDSETENVYTNLKSEINYENYNLSETIINDILLKFASDEMFSSSFSENKSSALEIVDATLKIEEKIKYEEKSRAVHPMGYIYYCYVDSTITQPNGSDWCGVASTLMALTGIENHDSNALISNYVRPTLTQIASATIPSGSTTPTVYNLTVYLNSKITGNKYTFTEIDSNTTKSQITNYIKTSLANNRPVLLHAKPYQAFQYYIDGGATWNSGHYIVVEAYEPGTGLFTVSDCTYIAHDPPYQGRHYNITIDEIYNSLYNPSEQIEGRYIIHG